MQDFRCIVVAFRTRLRSFQPEGAVLYTSLKGRIDDEYTWPLNQQKKHQQKK